MNACRDPARGRARRIDEFVFHEQARAQDSDTRSAPNRPSRHFEPHAPAVSPRLRMMGGGARGPASQLEAGGVPVAGTAEQASLFETASATSAEQTEREG